MHSLPEIQSTLRLALGNDALFSLVSTRVMLKTGVDLNRPEERTDPEAVKSVLEALAAMGYTETSLVTVAQRRK